MTATNEKTGEQCIVRHRREDFALAAVELAKQVGVDLDDGRGANG